MNKCSGCTLPSFRPKPNVTFVGLLTRNGHYRNKLTLSLTRMAKAPTQSKKLFQLEVEGFRPSVTRLEPDQIEG
jgi:hypothetical protein